MRNRSPPERRRRRDASDDRLVTAGPREQVGLIGQPTGVRSEQQPSPGRDIQAPAANMGLMRHANSLLPIRHTFHHSDRVNRAARSIGPVGVENRVICACRIPCDRAVLGADGRAYSSSHRPGAARGSLDRRPPQCPGRDQAGEAAADDHHPRAGCGSHNPPDLPYSVSVVVGQPAGSCQVSRSGSSRSASAGPQLPLA